MKYISSSLFVLFLALGVNAQQPAHDDHAGHNHGTQPAKPAVALTPGEDVLKLKETEHDFDKIPQGKPVYYNFEIVNTGKTPLTLDNVQASCGCTTPEWSRDPIAPGATAKIRVGYNAAAEGTFLKTITITYNSNQSKVLQIKGFVWKAPEGSAPANASVDFLKKQTL
ncbi:MAG: DUF1573 domain-containing protein [Bacteroidetes bacterium]|nr:DUF1573 domain-containing protein [Bacteroidota bacterium]